MKIPENQQWVLFKHPTYGIIVHKVFERKPFSFIVRFDFEVFHGVDILDAMATASTKEEIINKFPEYFI